MEVLGEVDHFVSLKCSTLTNIATVDAIVSVLAVATVASAGVRQVGIRGSELADSVRSIDVARIVD